MDETEFSNFYKEINRLTSEMDEIINGDPIEERFVIKDGKGKNYRYIVELSGHMYGKVIEKVLRLTGRLKAKMDIQEIENEAMELLVNALENCGLNTETVQELADTAYGHSVPQILDMVDLIVEKQPKTRREVLHWIVTVIKNN